MKAQDLDAWRARVSEEIAPTKNEELNKQSLEGIEIKPLYTSADLPDDESLPGMFPYTRGVKASMYAQRPWTIRQYAGFSSARESNRFYRENLAQGQRGLSVAFDLPTHRGYDSDDSRVYFDVGKAGVAIDTVDDMHVLFDGIDLSKVSVSMTMNGAVLPVLAAFVVCAQEKGLKLSDISGTIQNDILKEFMVRNTFIYPPKASMRIVADVMQFCAENLPKFNSISISGYHIHEAGADLALELGLTIADGIEYVRAAVDRGLNIDSFAPRLSFFFATGMNFFMEIAKLRAARTLWASIMKDMGALDERSMLLRTHCQTSGWSLAARDPYNNVIRTTIEAMASVLGGTQSLHTNSFDEALALPSKNSARLARNTQLILQHETKICDVVDPLGGSYYIEYLTAKLVKKARAIIQKIADAGGMTKALQEGLPMQWIEEAALRRQALIDSGREPIIGVNAFLAEHEEQIPVLIVDNEAVVREQRERLAHTRATRDPHKVESSILSLKKAARGQENLLAKSLEAMKNRVTVGELSQALEEVFTRFEPKARSSSGVYKLAYGEDEKMREILSQVQAFSAKAGRQPRILVAKMGQDGHDRGAKVIASAFADLGFDVDISPLFQDPASIVQQAIDNDVHVIGVSSLAGAHKSLAVEVLAELERQKVDDILVVVGGVVPPCDHASMLEAGVALIFGPGTSIIDAASAVLAKIKKR